MSKSEDFSDSNMKTSKKSDCLYDSGRTDSGFLSGALLSSSDDLSSPVSQKSVSEFDIKPVSYMRLDSGVDVGLNEQFSGLSLCKNDLNYNSKSSEYLQNKDNSNKCEVPEIKQPWEIYFQQDGDGDTQLHIAIIQGFIEVVYSLIRMAPHPAFLDILNDVVQSPLHLAVLTHQSRIVRQLIVSGANVERRDRHGNTPLHLACQIGDMDCVTALTEPIKVSEINNANLKYTGYTQQVPQDLEERNYEGQTCVHLAAYGEHIDILRHLTWFGADLNAREGKSGRTILHHAVETSSDKLLHFLLDDPLIQNSLELNKLTYSGHTALALASVLNSHIAKVLEDRGATNYGIEDFEDEDHPDHNEEDEMSDLENIYNLGHYQPNGEILRV